MDLSQPSGHPTVDALVELLGRYEQLHLYLDDAHGVSWCGEHGKGYIEAEFDKELEEGTFTHRALKKRI